MTLFGHVQNGVVVLDKKAAIADGTPVRVETLKQPRRRRRSPRSGTLGQRLMKFAGAVKGLPADMARNHDHYIHGTPKK